MKVETTKVSMLRITDVRGLDPIRVTLDDIGPGKGRINIECCGQAWASYWGAMGSQSIAEFFVCCDSGYLIENLAAHLDQAVFSGAQLVQRCQKRICKMRRSNELSKTKARLHFDEAEGLRWCEGMAGFSNAASREFLSDVYGAEWWRGVGEDAEAEHPKRAYLNRIIDAVRDALVMEAEAAHAAAA